MLHINLGANTSYFVINDDDNINDAFEITFSNGLYLKDAMKRMTRVLFSPFAGELVRDMYLYKRRPAWEENNEYLLL